MDRELAQGRRDIKAAPDDPRLMLLWAQQMVRADRFAELFSFFLGRFDQLQDEQLHILEWFLEYQEEVQEQLVLASSEDQRAFLNGLMSSGADASDFLFFLYEDGSWPESYPIEEFCEDHEIPLESLSTPVNLARLTKEAPIVVFTGLMSLLTGNQKALLFRIINSLKSPTSELKERFGRRRRRTGENPKG
ncbi:MAG: hypothetical protein P1V97_22660 [Planctomycetota bacterium]|nr:hypothetical protein [Planctomycetota bacterium]